MSVSKRIRFEVLRRDDYTCRYCGASAPDVRLVIDHVMPVALGGSDDPSNLVTACADCNAGKTSTGPGEHLVADVSADAVRWSRAMVEAARRACRSREEDHHLAEHFKHHIWDAWSYTGSDGQNHHPDLPIDWEQAVLRMYRAGLTDDDLRHATNETMTRTWVTDEFRYFMGVCNNILTDRVELAKSILAEEDD